MIDRVDRLPHALLLSGPTGGGKRDFAYSLAARLLCETASGHAEACGSCPSCTWFFAGNHPDFRMIEPGDGESPAEEEGTEEAASLQKRKTDQIRIGQIRELDSFFGVGTHRQGYRIILLNPAESMNQATANALLKTLEEPPPSTLFLLVTNRKRKILPTLLSRCQIIDFPKPEPALALSWLKEARVHQADAMLAHASGMPLEAAKAAHHNEYFFEFHKDIQQIEQLGAVTISARWDAWLKEGGAVVLDRETLVVWLQKWVFDLILMKSCGMTLFHAGKTKEIGAMSERSHLTALLDCYNDLLKIRAVARHPLNSRLFIEDMLFRYARAALTMR
ncbi:MAG TPA: DNA polymerase III subunit delta' [Candidatus Desulfobacillus sp.]|nr:DNA polymerase III subunit delta' [Candidatus Desulfobacillus sp.]